MIIIEIPIYCMTKERFDDKWKRYIAKKINDMPDTSKEIASRVYQEGYLCEKLWKYNQIIGYLTIEYKNSSIWLNQYMTKDKIFRVDSTARHFVYNTRLAGFHFHITTNMKNEDLRKKIKELVNSFEKEQLNKNYFLDKFDRFNTIEYLDIRKMIKI